MKKPLLSGMALTSCFRALWLALCAAGCAYAAEVKLDSSDGSTGFVVRNQGSAAVFSVDSAGAAVIAGTVAVAGAAFTVGGSTFVVKGGSVGVGTAAPATTLDVNGGLRVGNYTGGSMPAATGIAGAIVFNTTAGKLYVSDGAAWEPLGDAFDTGDATARRGRCLFRQDILCRRAGPYRHDADAGA